MSGTLRWGTLEDSGLGWGQDSSFSTQEVPVMPRVVCLCRALGLLWPSLQLATAHPGPASSACLLLLQVLFLASVATTYQCDLTILATQGPWG